MPLDRPKRVSYYAECDQATLTELAKLEQGVVFHTHGIELEFKVEDVARFATRTKLVKMEEISVGALSRESFLILLPQGLAVDRFIRATCPVLWERGFTFQPWSPEDQGRVVVPEYKVLLDVVGLPPHLYRTKEVARAIGTFGTYLGTIPQSNLANIASWTTAVAVDKLERVPLELEVNVRGFAYVAQLYTRKWLRSGLYGAAELATKHQRYTKAHLNPPSNGEPSPDAVHISLRVLRDICQGKELTTLPWEVQQILTGESQSRVLTIAQVEQVVGLHDTPPEQAQPPQGGDARILREATILGESDEAGQQTHSSQEATRKEAEGSTHLTQQGANHQPQQIRILQRIIPEETNSAGAQKLSNRPESQTDNQEGSRVRNELASGGGIEVGRKQNKDKAKVAEGHVQQKQMELGGSNRPRPNAKPTRKSAAQLPSGPISRQLLRGEPSRSKPNSRLGKRPLVQLNPKAGGFKRQTQAPTRERARRAKSRPFISDRADEAAQAQLTPEGFYEIAVQYSHSALLAAGCGLPVEEVTRALFDDNNQRMMDQEAKGNTEEEEEGPDICYDTDNDEMGSGEDLQ